MKSTAESTHISDDTLSGVSGASGFVPHCLFPPSLLISLWGSLSTLSTLCSSRWYLWTYMFSLDWLFVWFLFGFYSEPFLNSCNLSVINYLCNQFLQWATTKPHLLFSGPLRDDHLLASPVLWIPFLSQLYWVLMSCRYTSLDTRLPCSTLRAMLLCLAGPVLVNLHSQQTFPNLSPPCFSMIFSWSARPLCLCHYFPWCEQCCSSLEIPRSAASASPLFHPFSPSSGGETPIRTTLDTRNIFWSLLKSWI